LNIEVLRTVAGRYGPITFFANDIGAAGRSLELYGEWAENELGFVRNFIEAGSVVLDVGAYVGTHTLAFARFVGSDGYVFAFEPLRAAFEVLTLNVSANHLSNVRLENAAVADRAGLMEIPALNIANATSFGSTSLKDRPVKAQPQFEQRTVAQTKVAEVPVIAIDDLDLAKCSFIKIDAEGMESAVIRGATATIRRLTPVIYAECNSATDGLRSLEQLRELGYEVRLHVVEAFTQNNFFAVHENIFGRAREAALVGVHSDHIDRFEALAIRPCELLVKINTADDLVLGLLNKPQYAEEILRPSAAANSGAVAWLDEIACLRTTRGRLDNEVNWAKRAIAEERARGEQVAQAFAQELRMSREQLENEVNWAKGAIAEEQARARQEGQAFAEQLRATREQLLEAEQKLELYRTETNNQAALFEAAMRQAQFARHIADEASRSAADAEHGKEQAIAVQADLLTRNNALIQQLAQREKQLNAVYASTFWRLTSPARIAVDWLRGGPVARLIRGAMRR
jgi:FkbM family methyltransferase